MTDIINKCSAAAKLEGLPEGSLNSDRFFGSENTYYPDVGWNEYVAYKKGDPEIKLDGWFTAEDLKALSDHILKMRSKEC